ncbi:MAG: InlB B-repeat-containing protein [Acidimicrobiales bacterium]
MSVRAWLARIVISAVALTLLFAVTIIAAPFAAAATITQDPTTATGSVDIAGSSSFTAALSTPGFVGTTFAVTSTPTTPGLTLTGSEIATTGTLPAASYSISGTDSDPAGDTPGTWSYTLTVTDVIPQVSPNTGTIDVAGSSTFSGTLSVPGSPGATFVVTSTLATPGLTLTGNQIGTTGTLPAATYSISGTDSDTAGDTPGTWSYTLTVTSDVIVQGSPTTGFTTPATSSTFTDTLAAASGFLGPVTFATSTSGFAITSGDELESSGALSVSGSPYTITGTDSDTYGDAGTWTYSLTVAATHTPTNLIQGSPTTGTVLNTASSTFTAGPITVLNNSGAVTFVTTKAITGLVVSAAGLISTTGSLTTGTYTASGTDRDTVGDTGTWTYTLSVTGAPETVTFKANGGGGVMSPETDSAPTALSLNLFAWAKHTFVDWNTSADGTGVSYANGSLYPFVESTTLYAQWKAGRVPSRTITFLPNGGGGATPSETDNTPTAISVNHFQRAGYSFVEWNTSAKGSGTRFNAGATYSFSKSITLYAQWKKVVVKKPFEVVAFSANGGTGTMVDERQNRATPLTTTHFTRTGYTFVDWNTAANGSGTSYANGASYAFVASTDLFAQWKKIKKVAPPPPPPPPVPSGTQIGPFESGASTLTPSLKTQIQSLANQVKAEKITQIALLGYGDTLTTADERNLTIWSANIALSRQRAGAVATYLEQCLGSLKFTGWSISVAAAGSTKPKTAQGASSIVIAQLS